MTWPVITVPKPAPNITLRNRENPCAYCKIASASIVMAMWLPTTADGTA